MFAAESCVAAADRGALLILKDSPGVNTLNREAAKHLAGRAQTKTLQEEDYCVHSFVADTVRAERGLRTFLLKDTVLEEFLQELSDVSGSFFTSVR